jgi:hypothetical protein
LEKELRILLRERGSKLTGGNNRKKEERRLREKGVRPRRAG